MKKKLSVWMESGIVGGVGVGGLFLGVVIIRVIGMADGLGAGIRNDGRINRWLEFSSSLFRKTK